MQKYEDDKVGIYLRPMTYEDTEDIVRWRNQEDVKKFFIYRGEFTKEGHEKWIRTKVETGEVIQFVICDKTTDKALGSVYLRDIDRVHNKAEYGVFIGEASARGRGVGSAVARLMLRYGFAEEGLNRIYLRALAENLRAVRSYENAGFRREGYLKQDVMLDGEYKDVVWMAAVREDVIMK